MDFEERETMIAKRMHHHRRRWEMWRRHEYREKMRKQFRKMMQQRRIKMLKHFREQREKQRDYVRQMMFDRMVQQTGVNSRFNRYMPGIMQGMKLMGNSFGGHFGHGTHGLHGGFGQMYPSHFLSGNG